MTESNGQPLPQIAIGLAPDGSMQLRTNCTNKLTMLGMLELAKQLVLKPQEGEQSPIVVARGGL